MQDPLVELAIMDALRGASDLRDRLLVAMSTGTPSITDLAYAIKVRVKEDYKIREKVRLKREQKSYDVGNLRDIVGLRIVTLYRLDALRIIPLLLTAIEGDDSPSSVFKAGSVEEVIVYTTNAAGDPHGLASRMLSLFAERGLTAKVDQTSSNYTSIHIVVYGRGKYDGGYRDIPVEIQVRTAWEDVWGEIEHVLKYKRRKFQSGEESAVTPDRVETTLAHLNVMKTMIDGIAQYADQIKLQISELDGRQLPSTSKSAEDPDSRLGRLKGIPQELKDEITSAVALARPLMEMKTKIELPERVASLRASLISLERAAAHLREIQDLPRRSRTEVDYVVTMQRALILFQIGTLVEGGSAQLTQAVRLYADLEAKFPNRLVVRYRLARALDALGNRSEAIYKLKDMRRRLGLPRSQEPTPADHWLRAAVPRILGVLLWEEADALRRQSSLDQGGLDAVLALLLDAYQVTREAIDAQVAEDPGILDPSNTERSKAANNLLYYALDYLRSGGEPGPGITDADIRDFLELIGAGDVGSMTDFRLVDSALDAFLYLDDRCSAKSAARQLLKLLDLAQQGGIDSVHAEEMLGKARSVLDDPETPDEPVPDKPDPSS